VKPGKKRRGPDHAKRSRADRRRGATRAIREDELYVTGLNGARECLASPHITVVKVWADPARVPEELGRRLAGLGDRVAPLEDRATPYGGTDQGIAVLVKRPASPLLEDFIETLEPRGDAPLLVALDQVEDPMNLGQILRTCEGAGVDGILLPRHRSIHLTQTVAQVSQGAFAWVPLIEVTNLRNGLETLKGAGYWIVGLENDAAAQPWYSIDYTGPIALVFGSEGRGARQLTRETCDHMASLPMMGRLGSLNVGASVAAMTYEVQRQRAAKPCV